MLCGYYLAWKHSGACPYRLHHVLDGEYRPMFVEFGREVGDEVIALPPLYPRRLRNVIVGFAVVAEEDAARLAVAGARPV